MALDLPELLKQAVSLGASDLHLVPGNPPMARIKGRVEALPDAKPLSAESVQMLGYSVLTEDQRSRFEQDLELDCSFAVPELSRFRMNCYNHRAGMGAVLRVILSTIPTPDTIGITPEMIKLIEQPRGLVLVTGPAGSGKSTTLASLIEHLNKTRYYNIMTIEDPIEFVYENKCSIIQQREVGRQTKSFAEALRRSLRQDPNVILIGEMRDLETISLALTAAETGHLVLGTLHTLDAGSSVERIVDVFPADQQAQIRLQLSMTLKGVLSQLLLETKAGTQRVAARELMIVTSAISNLIRQGQTFRLRNELETGRAIGMFSMDQYLALLIQSGLVELDVALSKCQDPSAVRHLLRATAAPPKGKPKEDDETEEKEEEEEETEEETA
jgi:twitching motility protein PilT